MTVAVCHVMPALDVAPRHTSMPMPMPAPRQLDMWSAIQNQSDDSVTKPTPTPAKASYPPTVRRSMSHESLALCTESLGSETGTRGDFLDQAAVMACLYQTTDDDSSAALADPFLPPPPALQEGQEQDQDEMAAGELTAVQYHRARPQRAFPPPLPSMSRRRDDDGPCLRMRPHRRDGRLVVEAVAVKPQGYLHARRQGGRLRLCFVDCAASSARDRDHQKQSMAQVQQTQQQEELAEEEVEEDDVAEEDEEEDEVEVVDRGTMVEVVAASGKAQRCSRIVINKFVGGAPVTEDVSPSRCCRAAAEVDSAVPAPGMRRVPSSTTTLAAAVAAASTGMEPDEDDEGADNGGGLIEDEEQEKKSPTTMLLFTSRVGDREELVQSVRRCRQLRQRPLFIVEPYTAIAT